MYAKVQEKLYITKIEDTLVLCTYGKEEIVCLVNRLCFDRRLKLRLKYAINGMCRNIKVNESYESETVFNLHKVSIKGQCIIMD